jgi:hypothetical protein
MKKIGHFSSTKTMRSHVQPRYIPGRTWLPLWNSTLEYFMKVASQYIIEVKRLGNANEVAN